MSQSDDRQEKYGLTFPRSWSALDIELYCFNKRRTVDQGGLGGPEHFWRVVSFLWGKNNPVRNTSKIFIRNPWSEDMIEEACVHRYIGVGGSANSTKSETFALWLLVSFISNARKTLGSVLSTSLKQARKRIWGSLVGFIHAVPKPGLPVKVIDSTGIIRYMSPNFVSSDRESISLIAAERKQEKEAVGKLIGMHNDKVIIVADEHSELTESINEYAFPGGNLTSNPDYQFIGLANPASYYDPFAKLWKPKAGWTSVTVNDTRWETELGVGLHLDAFKSPNVLAGKTLYPFLPTIEKIEDAKRTEGGENSLRFWRMMRGFMCPVGQEDLIYAESDIVKFKGDEPAIFNAEPVIKVAALDPGFTNGGDRTILYFGTLGTSILGIRTLNYTHYIELIEDVTNKEENRSYQIARQFRDACIKEGILPRHAAVDSTGAGAPFCDVVDVVWSREVLRVKFGGKASELPVSMTDPAKGNERYYDRVTEIWYSGKELLRNGQLKGISPEMAKEMSARRYGTTGAEVKIYVESKADMKLRTGKSPDIADAAFILLALCRERLHFGVRLVGDAKTGLRLTGWRNIRARLGAVRRGGMPMRLKR
jgi:hypothetical protein